MSTHAARAEMVRALGTQAWQTFCRGSWKPATDHGNQAPKKARLMKTSGTNRRVRRYENPEQVTFHRSRNSLKSESSTPSFTLNGGVYFCLEDAHAEMPALVAQERQNRVRVGFVTR